MRRILCGALLLLLVLPQSGCLSLACVVLTRGGRGCGALARAEIDLAATITVAAIATAAAPRVRVAAPPGCQAVAPPLPAWLSPAPPDALTPQGRADLLRRAVDRYRAGACDEAQAQAYVLTGSADQRVSAWTLIGLCACRLGQPELAQVAQAQVGPCHPTEQGSIQSACLPR